MEVVVLNAAFLILDPRWCRHSNKLKSNGLPEKSCLRSLNSIVLKLSIIRLLQFLCSVKFQSSYFLTYHLHVLNQKKKSAANCVKTCVILTTSRQANQFVGTIINCTWKLRVILGSFKWFKLEFFSQNQSNGIAARKTTISVSNNLIFIGLSIFKINFTDKAVILTDKMTKLTLVKSVTDSEGLIPKTKSLQSCHVGKKLNSKLSICNGKINLRRVFSKLLKNEKVLCKFTDNGTYHPRSMNPAYILEKVGCQMILTNKSHAAFYTRKIVHDNKKLSQEISVYLMNFNKSNNVCPDSRGNILKYDVDIQVSRMRSTIKDYSMALNVERFYMNVSSRKQSAQQVYRLKEGTSSSTSTKESSPTGGSDFSELDSVSMRHNRSKCVREKMSTKLLGMFKKLITRTSKMDHGVRYRTASAFDDHVDIGESEDTFIKPKRRKKRLHSASSDTTNEKPYDEDNFKRMFEKCSHIYGGAEDGKHRSTERSPVPNKKKGSDRSPNLIRKGTPDYTRVRSENNKSDKAKNQNANYENAQTNPTTQNQCYNLKPVNNLNPSKLAGDSFDTRTFSVKENSFYSRNGTSIDTGSQRNRVCKRKSCEVQNDKAFIEVPRKRKRSQPKGIYNPSDVLHLMNTKFSHATTSYEGNLNHQNSDFAKLMFCNISEFSAPSPSTFKTPHMNRSAFYGQAHDKRDHIPSSGTPMSSRPKLDFNNFCQPNYTICYAYEKDKAKTSVNSNSIKKDVTHKQLDILYSNDAMRCSNGYDFEKDSFTHSFDLDDTLQSFNQELTAQCGLTNNSLINLDNFQKTWADYDAESSLMNHSISNNTNDLSVLIQDMKPVCKSDEIYDNRFCYSMPEIKKKICSTENENTSTETQNSALLNGKIDLNNFSYNNVIRKIEKTVIEIKRRDHKKKQRVKKDASEKSSIASCGIQTDNGITNSKEKMPRYVERKCSPIVSDIFSETKVYSPAETNISIQATTQPLFSTQNFNNLFSRNCAYGAFNSFIPDPFQYWYFGSCLSRNMGFLYPESYARYDYMQHRPLCNESTLVDDIFNRTKTQISSDLKEKVITIGSKNAGGRTAKDRAAKDVKSRKSVQFQLKSHHRPKDNSDLHKMKRNRQFDEIEDLFYIPKSEEIFIRSQTPDGSKNMSCQRNLKNRRPESRANSEQRSDIRAADVVGCVPSLDQLFEDSKTDRFGIPNEPSQARKRDTISKINTAINKSNTGAYGRLNEGEEMSNTLSEESEVNSDNVLYNSTQTTMFSNVKNKVFVKQIWDKVKNTANLKIARKPIDEKTVIFHSDESDNMAHSGCEECNCSGRCNELHHVCEYHELKPTSGPPKSPHSKDLKQDAIIENQRAQVSHDLFDLSTCYNLLSVEDMVNQSNSDFKFERPCRGNFDKQSINTKCEDPDDILYESIRKSCKNTLQREMHHWLVKEKRKKDSCNNARVKTCNDLKSDMGQFYESALMEDLIKLRLPPIPEPPYVVERSEKCNADCTINKAKPEPVICECPCPPPRQYILKVVRENVDSDSQNRCNIVIMKYRSKELLIPKAKSNDHVVDGNRDNHNSGPPSSQLNKYKKYSTQDNNERCSECKKGPETERNEKAACKNDYLVKLNPCFDDHGCYCGHDCHQKRVVLKSTKQSVKCTCKSNKKHPRTKCECYAGTKCECYTGARCECYPGTKCECYPGTICECYHVQSPIVKAFGATSPNVADTSELDSNAWKANDVPSTRTKPNFIYQARLSDNNRSSNLVQNVFGFPQPMSKRHVNCYQSLIDKQLFNNTAESKCRKYEIYAKNCFNETHEGTGLRSKIRYENKFSQTLKASVDNINTSYSKVNLSNIIMYTESVGNVIIDDFYNQKCYSKMIVADSNVEIPVFKQSTSMEEKGIVFYNKSIALNKSNSSLAGRHPIGSIANGIKKNYCHKSYTRRLVRKENYCDLTKKRIYQSEFTESNTRIRVGIDTNKNVEPIKLIPPTQLVYDRKTKVAEDFKDTRKTKEGDEKTGAEQTSSKYNSTIADQLKKDILQLECRNISNDIDTVSSYPNYIDIDKIRVKKYAGDNDDSIHPSEYSSNLNETKDEKLLEEPQPELQSVYDKSPKKFDIEPINIGIKIDNPCDDFTGENFGKVHGNVNNHKTSVNESIVTGNVNEIPKRKNLYGQQRFQKFWCYRASTDTSMRMPFLSKNHLGHIVDSTIMTKSKSQSREIGKQGTLPAVEHSNASEKLASNAIYLSKLKMQLQEVKRKIKRSPQLRNKHKMHNIVPKSDRESKENKNYTRGTRRNRSVTSCTICKATLERNKKYEHLENHYQVNRFSICPKPVQKPNADNAVMWNYDSTMRHMCSILYNNNDFNTDTSSVSFSISISNTGYSNCDFDKNEAKICYNRNFKSENAGSEFLDYENLPDLSELILQSDRNKNAFKRKIQSKEGTVAKGICVKRPQSRSVNKMREPDTINFTFNESLHVSASKQLVMVLQNLKEVLNEIRALKALSVKNLRSNLSNISPKNLLNKLSTERKSESQNDHIDNLKCNSCHKSRTTAGPNTKTLGENTSHESRTKKVNEKGPILQVHDLDKYIYINSDVFSPDRNLYVTHKHVRTTKPICTWRHSNCAEVHSSNITSEERNDRAKRILDKIESIYPTYFDFIDSLESSSSNEFVEFNSDESNWESIVDLVRQYSSTSCCHESSCNEHCREIVLSKRKLTEAKSGRDKRVTFLLPPFKK